MKLVIDDFAFTYPGIRRVQHAYFHAVYGADAALRSQYLETAYRLGYLFED